jgi:RNA polymerase sigma-70 factor (ECF subfamily)
VTDDPSGEEALLARARAGDEAACRALVERHEGTVAGVVQGMLGAGDEADDVGQETFIRFFRSLERFRGESSVRTYLQRIAINLSLNALKRRQRGFRRFLPLDDADEGAEQPATLPVDHAEAGELHAMVNAALDQLSPRHRPVVVLRMMEGYSTRETADLLGVPEGTVLSRLARAMSRLEELLGPAAREWRNSA